MGQQPAFQYIRHGQFSGAGSLGSRAAGCMCPFFRLSTVAPHEGRGYEGHDAILLGVPWDGASTGQPGARFAPFHVRRVSAFLQTFHPVHKVDIFETLRVADGGNVVFPPFSPELVRHMITQEVENVLEANAVPVLLGGDHSIALPAMRAVAKKNGPLAVVHIDAHLDTSDASVWGDEHHHGTPLRHAITEGLIRKDRLFQIGIRASWGQPDEGALAAAHGARLFTVDDLSDRGPAAIAAEIRVAVKDEPTYITFDIDGIDPAFAPGTGTPEPGGLTSREAFRLLRGLAGSNIVGCDVVEVCPALDVGDRTSTLAAHLLWEMLALIAMR